MDCTMMYNKKKSLYGQNTLIFEFYPNDINTLCEGFSTTWAYCGLGHPHLDNHRMAIIACNVGSKTLYYAQNLHSTIHAGISAETAYDYISLMLQRGYDLCTSDTFSKSSKKILVVGSDESVEIPGVFSIYNYESKQFQSAHNDFFVKLNLPMYGMSLLKAKDEKKLRSQHTSRGQPMVLNMSYSIQNCRDNTTSPGMNLPKLTTSDLQGIKYLQDENPISHRMLAMMTEATLFLTSHYEMLHQNKPFTNARRNTLFGNRIGTIIGHPDTQFVSFNSFEGMTGVVKTQDNAFFGSHVDSQNPQEDNSYTGVLVASQAMTVPVNDSIPFGSKENMMFPCAIFYNQRGCES